ncbi:redoxin domain-containing protein [Parasynechococcus sp.]|uniref:redoxin domain-containing protein n=1 Tax=Parasynechococcus sp. TaxID=3101203 RepID=UPI003703E239
METGATVSDFDLPGSSQSEPDRKQASNRDLRGRSLTAHSTQGFTGGCTIEARGFESLHNGFLQAGVEVSGISADSVDDHKSFCESEGLSFPLLSDPD